MHRHTLYLHIITFVRIRMRNMHFIITDDIELLITPNDGIGLKLSAREGS